MPKYFKSRKEMVDAVVSGKVVTTDKGMEVWRNDLHYSGAVFFRRGEFGVLAATNIWQEYAEFYIKPEPQEEQITDRLELMKEIIRMWDNGERFLVGKYYTDSSQYCFPQWNSYPGSACEDYRYLPIDDLDGKPRKFMRRVEG